MDSTDIHIDAQLLEGDLLSVDRILPSQLYIIPIRYRPIFPGIVTPLIISHGRFSEAVDRALPSSRTIGLVLLKDDEIENIGMGDLFQFGTASKILKKINLPDGGINVLINSVKRFVIKKVVSEKPHIIAEVSYIDEEQPKKNMELKALTRAVLTQLKLLSENNPLFTEEMKLTMVNVEEPGKIADFVASMLSLEKQEYQKHPGDRQGAKAAGDGAPAPPQGDGSHTLQKKLQGFISDKMDRQQREFFLREQLKAIKTELGMEEDERAKEIKEMKRKAEQLSLKGEAKEKLSEETEKLSLTDVNSSEYSITRNYVETVISLPWNLKTVDNLDIERAERVLNRDHYALDDVKKRILEFLAVRKLKPDSRGSIICLVGPPGVGKTSLGKSIARALQKKFFRISLGGMRDEAEIKGHRRTYIGAMPGKDHPGTQDRANPGTRLHAR